jgi:hypothetical protein
MRKIAVYFCHLFLELSLISGFFLFTIESDKRVKDKKLLNNIMDGLLNIVELIENNPVTRLSGSYQNKMIIKIKEKFTDNEQQIFVASFYSFLNYDSKTDFIIDLDNVWKWLEFYTKQKAKELLEKYFIINKDYIKLLTPQGKQSVHIKGGHNREIFLLNIETFKKFCLKAGTKKADEIHDYYIKLEETLQEVIHEESNELKLQLEQATIDLKNSENNNEKIREKTLLEQFSNNIQCVYYGIIDNMSNKNEKLIKFGNSNNLKNRVTKHKDTYQNFRLVNAFKVENKLQIENALKCDKFFTERLRTLVIKNKKYVEILSADNLTFMELDKKIKEIITSIEYSPENYKKILDENKQLREKMEQKNEENNINELVLLRSENKRLKLENLKLLKNYKPKENIHDVTEFEIENYGIIMNELKPQRYSKNKEGKYEINGKNYDALEGSRENVWNEFAYKTTGGLTKLDLIINKDGKIVSKKKSINETISNKFEKVNELKKN